MQTIVFENETVATLSHPAASKCIRTQRTRVCLNADTNEQMLSQVASEFSRP